MGRDLDAITITLHNRGWFRGLNEVLKEKKINTDEYAKLKSYCFGLLAKKLMEAKQELRQLEAVFGRLDAVCQHGSVQKPFQGSVAAPDPEVERLREELKAFHGWTVSLVETDYYFLATSESPGTARDKFAKMSPQLLALTTLRGVRYDGFSGKGHITL